MDDISLLFLRFVGVEMGFPVVLYGFVPIAATGVIGRCCGTEPPPIVDISLLFLRLVGVAVGCLAPLY